MKLQRTGPAAWRLPQNLKPAFLVIGILALAGLMSAPQALHGQSLNFQTIEGWTDGVSGFICGAPGERACSNLLHNPCTSNGNISILMDPYTWLDNCDLQPPVCTTSIGPTPIFPHDLTFATITDTHLLNGFNITNFEHATHAYELNHIGSQGWDWSQANAGFSPQKIAVPWSVVATGDISTDGQQTSLGGVRLLYETGNATDSLNYPYFPGLGNHDVMFDCGFDNCAKRMFDYVGKAAACLPNGVDPNSHNYSWEWGNYHMVQLNKWAGDTQLGSNNSLANDPSYTHASGLPWLIQDLALHVGNSGRPVIFFQHFGWDPKSVGDTNSDGTPTWWSAGDRTVFLDAIKDYNVAAIFSGHYHNTSMWSATVTDSAGQTKIIDDFTGGTGGQGGHGEFFMVRLTDQFLDVLPVEWADPLTVLGATFTPYMTTVGSATDPSRRPFANNVNGCRKWMGPQLAQVPVSISTNGQTVTFTNTGKGTLNGPFAVGLSFPGTVRLNQYEGNAPANPPTIFTTSCAQGPYYQISSKSSLGPGESDTVTMDLKNDSGLVDVSTAGQPYVVTLGSDSLIASPQAVSISPSQSASIALSTVYNRTVPVSVQSDQNWITAVLDQSSTPAQIKVSLNTARFNSNAGNVIVTSSDAAYSKVILPVTVPPVPVTIQTSGHETVTVDGQSVTTPYTAQWTPLSTHHISTVDVQGQGIVDRFISWSDGLAAAHVISVPFAGETLTAQFTQFGLVTATASPANGGTITVTPASPDGYYAFGSKIHLAETTNPGFVFSSFADQPNGQTSYDATLLGALNVGAKFLAAGSYLVTTSLGINGGETIDAVAFRGPASVQWGNNSQHTISVPAEVDQAPGQRDLFTQWSDGVTALTRTVTAGSINTWTAQYQRQYLVSTSASPASGGTVSGGGWYNDQASANLTASPAAGYSFSGFSGDVTAAANPATLTVGRTDALVANFTPGTPSLNISASPRGVNPDGSVQMSLLISNNGAGAAVNAQMGTITTMVQSGTGSVNAITAFIGSNTIAPGLSVQIPVTFAWPATAKRVAFTVSVSANSGSYTAKSTFYLLHP